MYRLIESIRLEDGAFGNLSYHQQRLENAFRHLYKGSDHIDLEKVLHENFFPDRGLFKCRVTYDSSSYTIQYDPYTIRPVLTLKKIAQNEIIYNFKYENRQPLNQIFNDREACDDVLIIKNELVTDTSYANIVFKKKNGEWVTPSSCLLKGTMRQVLLDRKIIKEEQVSVDALSGFSSFKLINSMLQWNSAETDISNIV